MTKIELYTFLPHVWDLNVSLHPHCSLAVEEPFPAAVLLRWTGFLSVPSQTGCLRTSLWHHTLVVWEPFHPYRNASVVNLGLLFTSNLQANRSRAFSWSSTLVNFDLWYLLWALNPSFSGLAYVYCTAYFSLNMFMYKNYKGDMFKNLIFKRG